MHYKSKPFDIKSISDTGEVTGYFSTYDIIADSYGDIIAPHAFDKTIMEKEKTGRPFPLVWNHNMDDPENIIGQVDKIEEDDHGPLMTAHFYSTQKAQHVRDLVKSGAVYQFSFAYDIESARKPNELEKQIDPNIKQVLESVNLLEVTITPTPANPRAEVTSSKVGRRNSEKDADKLRQAITLLEDVLGELDDTEPEEESSAKSEELDTVNDEERERKALMLKEAEELLTKE